MLRKVKGNLLEADAEALVNTVNCVGVMGKGIALQFKQAYPEVFRAYARACQAGQVKPGQMHIYDLGGIHNPRYVINFPTKQHWKGKSKMGDIESGLAALIADVKRYGIRSIALPPLGCGNGGLDWNQVYRRIEQAFAALPDVDVLVYEPAGAPPAAAMKTRTQRPKMTPGRASLLGLMKRYIDGQMDDQITLLEVHKLMYFMQAAGEPLRLQYVQAKYGPYATELHHVLERIEGHFVSGYGDGIEAPDKVLTYMPDAAVEAQSFLNGQPDTLSRFQKIEQLIEGFETPYGMELLSSVHWVACNVNAEARKNSQAAIEGVHGWSQRKSALFKSEHIQAAWQRLWQQQWL